MKNRISLMIVLLGMALGASAQRQSSGNPIAEGWYADPEAVVWDGRCWVFPTYAAEYDKQLHFIVIGVLGMIGIFIFYPLFKLLAKYDHEMVIAFLYVFTLVLVVSFAIEIGQWYSGTGRMESEDMAYGIAGFLIMFLIFAFIRGLFLAIKSLLGHDEEREEERRRLAGKH